MDNFTLSRCLDDHGIMALVRLCGLCWIDFSGAVPVLVTSCMAGRFTIAELGVLS